MTTNRDATTAQILRFPLERRLKGRVADRAAETAAEEPRVSFDGWYHEAAIEEDRAVNH